MRRAFDSTLALDADGRDVYGRILPFGVRAHIREIVDEQVDEYDEEFLPGCTARIRQVAASRGGAPAWISFSLDHDRSFDFRLGFCRELDEQPDGVYARFRLHDDPVRLPKIRSMLDESHRGLSVEFSDVGRPLGGDFRRHRQIHVADVTATPLPIYTGARILAMRSDEDPLESAGTPHLDRVRAMLAAS